MPDPIQKIELSRYAVQLLGAHPQWRSELTAPAPFTRAEMQAALQAIHAEKARRHSREPKKIEWAILMVTHISLFEIYQSWSFSASGKLQSS